MSDILTTFEMDLNEQGSDCIQAYVIFILEMDKKEELSPEIQRKAESGGKVPLHTKRLRGITF